MAGEIGAFVVGTDLIGGDGGDSLPGTFASGVSSPKPGVASTSKANPTPPVADRSN